MPKHQLSLVVLAVSFALDPAAQAQTQCQAFTEAQLQSLLDCIANCGTSSCNECADICSHKHIVIPAGVTLQFQSTFHLNEAHQGLRLTIDGTLQYAGEPGSNNWDMPYLIYITGAPQQNLNITIDGSGAIRTPYVACQSWNGQQQTCVTPPGGVMFIAEGIVIRNNARNVTVKDVRLENMFWGILVDNTATNLLFQNLTIEEMTLYGIFNDGLGVTIQNCAFDGAYHGFGIGNYGSDVQINKCVVTNSGGGFHVRGGHNISIDGFASHGQWCNVGPDPGLPDEDLRTTCVDIRNLTITGQHPAHLLFVDLGLANCWIENLTTENPLSLEVGRYFSWSTLRPMHAVHWKNVSGGYYIYNHACMGDVGPKSCRADVTGDGIVNVSDLLAVIGNWGPCGNGWVCGQAIYHCPADVPGTGLSQCDVVNVTDLLVVINSWGPCN